MEKELEGLDELASVCTIDDPVICCCGDGYDLANSDLTIDS
jgi:hypothetical protein